MSTDRTLDRVLTLLRARAAELRRGGVLHAAVFGSVARGEEISDSDVDIMIELDPAQRLTLLSYARIVRQLETLSGPLGRRIDIAQRRRLRPHVRPAAERDAVQAF
jgi:predicted nucleotidyltransferase